MSFRNSAVRRPFQIWQAVLSNGCPQGRDLTQIGKLGLLYTKNDIHFAQLRCSYNIINEAQLNRCLRADKIIAVCLLFDSIQRQACKLTVELMDHLHMLPSVMSLIQQI